MLDDVLGLGEHSHALKIKMSTIVPTMQDWGQIMSHNFTKLSTSVILFRDGETGRHMYYISLEVNARTLRCSDNKIIADIKGRKIPLQKQPPPIPQPLWCYF